MGDGHVELVGNELGRLDVGGVGLLEVEDVVFLQGPAQLDGGLGVGEGVVLHDDVHARADGLPAGGHPVLHHLDVVGGEQAGLNLTGHGLALFGVAGAVPDRTVHVVVEEVQLHAVVALGHGDAAVFGVLLGLAALVVGAGAPAVGELAGVGAQVVPALAAQQLVDGNVEGLALDVPQGDVQGGDPGEDHRAAVLAPEGAFVELIPDDFVVQRVHADDESGQVLDHAERRGGGHAVGQSGLAVSVDPLVGVDPAEDGTPAGLFHGSFLQENVYLRDLHANFLLNNMMNGFGRCFDPPAAGTGGDGEESLPRAPEQAWSASGAYQRRDKLAIHFYARFVHKRPDWGGGLFSLGPDRRLCIAGMTCRRSPRRLQRLWRA